LRFLQVAERDLHPTDYQHSGREADRKDPLYAAFYLMLTCGLRRGEVLGLKWEDTDLTAGLLRVRGALVTVGGRVIISEPKSGNARRTIHLASDALQVLRDHQTRWEAVRVAAVDAWQETNFIFTTTLGGPLHPRNLVRSFHWLCQVASVRRIRLHDLHHTHASLALRRGALLEVLSVSASGTSTRRSC